MSKARRPGGVPPARNDGAVDPWVVLGVVMVGTFLAPLDSSIVNIALPAIAADMGARLTAVGWVATAYLLTSAALVLTMGRFGDVWGLRRVYAAGFVVFGAGSLACALSPALPHLIAARVAQAVGAAMFFAVGPAIVVAAVPPDRRGRALGWVTLAVSAGLTLGPPLGGFLVGTFGWPSVFLINVPLSAVAALAALRWLPADRPQYEPFDIAGAVLFAGALVSVLLALSEADRFGWGSAEVLGLFAAFLALGTLFLRHERAATHPMMDLTLFRSVPFSAGVVAAVLCYMSLFAVTFLMPFYLLRVLGLDARLAGALLVATPLSMAAFAPVSGRLADRVGSRWPATAGMGWLSASLLGMMALGVATPLALIAGLLLSVGVGVAFFQSPNTVSILNATPPRRRGVGSAIVGAARNVGMTLGIAVTGAVVALYLGGSALLAEPGVLAADEAVAFVSAMRPAFAVAGAAAAIGAAVSWQRGGPATR